MKDLPIWRGDGPAAPPAAAVALGPDGAAPAPGGTGVALGEASDDMGERRRESRGEKEFGDDPTTAASDGDQHKDSSSKTSR